MNEEIKQHADLCRAWHVIIDFAVGDYDAGSTMVVPCSSNKDAEELAEAILCRLDKLEKMYIYQSDDTLLIGAKQ